MSHPLHSNVPPPPQPPSKKCATTANVRSLSINVNECLWSVDYPELQKACYLSRVCQFVKPKLCHYIEIPSILQIGPTCGLTALSTLLKGKASQEQLLNEAKKRHFTNNGEMFSAQYLFELVRTQLEEVSSEAFCMLHEGKLDCEVVKESLLAGACLLVPYDPSGNHAPCLKFGHKAHWALLIGFLITENDEFYVLARHGKSKNIAVWSLANLSESNANLVEFAQPKGYADCCFLLPPGGIGGTLGLRERAIIVKGLPQKHVHIE